MGIIFLMSDSSNEEKCGALYKLYDYSNNNSLSKLEIEHMLSRLLMKVDEFTKELIKENELKINGKVIEGNDKQMVFFIVFYRFLSILFKKAFFLSFLLVFSCRLRVLSQK